MIELEGYSVLQAASVKEGLKLLQKENIQVVISDVKLPDGNGVELTARIKKEYPAIEVIVITAYGTIADGGRLLKMARSIILRRASTRKKSFRC